MKFIPNMLKKMLLRLDFWKKIEYIYLYYFWEAKK